MVKKFLFFYVFCASTILCFMGCKGEVVDEYTTHVASFRFDFQYGHNQSYLYSALNSTNYFCFFSTNPIQGGYDLVTEAYGTKEKNVEHITEAVLTKSGRALGLNNGLIAGRSSFQNGELYVFDRQCPNCFNETNTKNFTLNFKDASSVFCNSCKRTYGLLNGGVVVSDSLNHEKNEKLFRYRATYSGTYFQISSN